MVGAHLVWICFGSTLHPVCWLAANKGLGDAQTCVKMFHVILVVTMESCVGCRSNISPLRLLCSTPFSFFFWASASKHRSFTPSLHPLNIRFSKAGGGSSIFWTFTSKAPHCATPKRTLEFSQLRRLQNSWGACRLFSPFHWCFPYEEQLFAMRLWYNFKKKQQQKLLSFRVAFWMEALGTPTCMKCFANLNFHGRQRISYKQYLLSTKDSGI